MDIRDEGHAASPAELSAVQARIAETGNTVRCGAGWTKVIQELDKALSEIDPDYYLFSVSRHRGRLRFHAEPSHSAFAARFDAMVRSAAETAAQTCEVCGAPGRSLTFDGLAEVLCLSHAASADAAGDIIET